MNQVSDKDQILIQKYLADSLTTDELELFESRLSDDSFNKELMLQAKLLDSLDAIDKELVIEEITANTPKINTNRPKAKSKLIWVIGLIIIATVAWLAYLQLPTQPVTMAHLVEKYDTPYPPAAVERGASTKQNKFITEAMAAYVNQDYELALENFGKIAGRAKFADFYIVTCFIKTRRYQKAIDMLVVLGHDIDPKVMQNSDWYRAIAYLGLENKPAATEQLNKIVSNKKHLFYSKAKKLLREF